jgi:hypothetical protein
MATEDRRRGQARMNRAGSGRDNNVVSLGRDIQVKIGQHLRTMYDEVVKQGVPDQFNDLLQKLDDSEKDAEKDHGR